MKEKKNNNKKTKEKFTVVGVSSGVSVVCLVLCYRPAESSMKRLLLVKFADNLSGSYPQSHANSLSSGSRWYLCLWLIHPVFPCFFARRSSKATLRDS